LRRLDLQLARAYAYAESHFGGQNLYLEELHKNVRYAQVLADAPGAEILRRTPPVILNPSGADAVQDERADRLDARAVDPEIASAEARR